MLPGDEDNPAHKDWKESVITYMRDGVLKFNDLKSKDLKRKGIESKVKTPPRPSNDPYVGFVDLLNRDQDGTAFQFWKEMKECNKVCVTAGHPTEFLAFEKSLTNFAKALTNNWNMDNLIHHLYTDSGGR